MKTLLSSLALAGLVAVGSARSADYVAHEWGTFTSVQAADGRPLEWNPLTVVELPGFVYDLTETSPTNRRGSLRLYAAKTAFRTLQRMETPVIYFRSDQPVEVDVEVRFPQGLVTEWYPQARPLPRRAGEMPRRDRIAWDDVRVLPMTHPAVFPEDARGSHYFAARQAEANPLAVPRTGSAPEQEKFLFYRGVGGFEAPLKVVTTDDARSLQLSNLGPRPLGALWVFQLREGRGAVQRLEGLEEGHSQEVRLTTDRHWKSQSELIAEATRGLKEDLVGQGLTESEARAMVSTWTDSWFAEPGIRVLYLLPSAWVDETLPLRLQPPPRELVRVFVGRSEVLSPAVEFALLRQMLRYSDGSDVGRAEALNAIRTLGLGRFAEVAVRHVVAAVPPNRQFSNHAWELLEALSQPTPESSAVVPGFRPASAVTSTHRPAASPSSQP